MATGKVLSRYNPTSFGADSGFIPTADNMGYRDALGKWHPISPGGSGGTGGGLGFGSPSPTSPVQGLTQGAGNLPSTTLPNTTGTVGGSTSWTSQTGQTWGTNAAIEGGDNTERNKKIAAGLGGAAGLAAGFMSGGDSKGDRALQDALAAAKGLGTTGKTLSGEGQQSLAPVLHYLALLNSGDPQALLEATMPERRRVIDQYDTARQASQFSPRGGGTSSAMVDLNAREAGDLAALGAKARTDSLKMSADLGTNLSQLGAGTQSQSVDHMVNLMKPLLAKEQSNNEDTFKTFANIASIAMMFV
jgi:hypothetical protein